MRLHIRKQITGFFKQENEVNKIMVEKKTAGHMAVHAFELCVSVSAGALGSQRPWMPLELESQVVVSSVMWVLGLELGTSEKRSMS